MQRKIEARSTFLPPDGEDYSLTVQMVVEVTEIPGECKSRMGDAETGQCMKICHHGIRYCNLFKEFYTSRLISDGYISLEWNLRIKRPLH